MHRWIPIALLGLFLSACAVLPGPNRQGYAGINDVEINLVDGVPTDIRVIGGKEQQDVSVEITLPNGLVAKYSATETRAFDAHRIRGEVEKALAEMGVAITPAITEGIVNAIKLGIGLP